MDLIYIQVLISYSRKDRRLKSKSNHFLMYHYIYKLHVRFLKYGDRKKSAAELKVKKNVRAASNDWLTDFVVRRHSGKAFD